MRTFAIAIITALSLCSAFGAETFDSQMSTLAQTIAKTIKGSGIKNVTVLDFTDLEGKKVTKLGRYIAAQLTANLDSSKKEFTIVDRANRERILDEHKLTASGLVDPKTAKEFGKISGVDALILGIVTELPKSVKVFVTIMATDTAVRVGSGECRVTKDDDVRFLIGPGVESGGGANIDNGNVAPKSEGPKTGDATTRTKGNVGAIGCPMPMSPQEFSDLKKSVSSKSFENTKLTIAKQATGNSCLLASQVKEVMKLFDFEATKLTYAKFAYRHTYDIGNYYKVNDAFDFESSVENLNRYIGAEK